MNDYIQFLTEASSASLDKAKHIITTLRQHGFQGFIAGGSVRDCILGVPFKDVDVVTDCVPDELKKIFPNSELVGEKFGVVIVNGIDVATFRKDSDIYSDGRRPDFVEFSTSAYEDSKSTTYD